MATTNNVNKFEQFKISLLALLFGTGSWIALTGLWLEMPLLLQQLPEGWSLASHLNMMIQLANIGPLLYWLLHRRYRLINDISITHFQMWIGLLSCVVLIGFWNKTITMFGNQHSIILLIFTFGLALVDCTSSVTFLPFMARFDSNYMTPYLVGEGLSGFIPSIVVLIQGVGDPHGSHCQYDDYEDDDKINGTTMLDYLSNDGEVINAQHELIQPRFSVEVFFTSLLITLVISYLAFLALEFLPFAKREQQRNKQLYLMNRDNLIIDSNNNANNTNNNSSGDIEAIQLSTVNNIDSKLETKKNRNKVKIHLDKKQQGIYYYLLALIFWNCFTTFGFMPPLQPFSALPYSVDTLHYIVILASLSYPAGCFLGMLQEYRSIWAISLLTLVATGLAIWMTICSCLSPYPPMVNTNFHQFGSILMVVCWVSFVIIASYAKTMITLVICDYNSRHGMFWVGMNTQFGAAIGAMVIFTMINYTTIFNECA